MEPGTSKHRAGVPRYPIVAGHHHASTADFSAHATVSRAKARLAQAEQGEQRAQKEPPAAAAEAASHSTGSAPSLIPQGNMPSALKVQGSPKPAGENLHDYLERMETILAEVQAEHSEVVARSRVRASRRSLILRRSTEPVIKTPSPDRATPAQQAGSDTKTPGRDGTGSQPTGIRISRSQSEAQEHSPRAAAQPRLQTIQESRPLVGSRQQRQSSPDAARPPTSSRQMSKGGTPHKLFASTDDGKQSMQSSQPATDQQASPESVSAGPPMHATDRLATAPRMAQADTARALSCANAAEDGSSSHPRLDQAAMPSQEAATSQPPAAAAAADQPTVADAENPATDSASSESPADTEAHTAATREAGQDAAESASSAGGAADGDALASSFQGFPRAPQPVLTTVPEHDGRLDDRSTGTQSPLGQDLNMSDWYGYNPMSSVTLEMTTSDTSVDESFGDMVLMASPIKGATGRMGFSTPTRRVQTPFSGWSPLRQHQHPVFMSPTTTRPVPDHEHSGSPAPGRHSSQHAALPSPEPAPANVVAASGSPGPSRHSGQHAAPVCQGAAKLPERALASAARQSDATGPAGHAGEPSESAHQDDDAVAVSTPRESPEQSATSDSHQDHSAGSRPRWPSPEQPVSAQATPASQSAAAAQHGDAADESEPVSSKEQAVVHVDAALPCQQPGVQDEQPARGTRGAAAAETVAQPQIPAAQTPTDELATPARAPMTAEQCREDSKAGQAAVGRDPASGADGVPAECASTLLVARFLASPHAGLLSASDSIASHPVDLDSSDDALSVGERASSTLSAHSASREPLLSPLGEHALESPSALPAVLEDSEADDAATSALRSPCAGSDTGEDISFHLHRRADMRLSAGSRRDLSQTADSTLDISFGKGYATSARSSAEVLSSASPAARAAGAACSPGGHGGNTGPSAVSASQESSVVSQANSPLYDHTRYEGSSSESATSTPRDALVPLVHKKQSSVTAISIVASVPLLDSLPGPPAMTSIRHETGHAIRPGEHATATPAVFAEPAPVSPKKQAILQLRARRLHTRIADVRYSLRTSTVSEAGGSRSDTAHHHSLAHSRAEAGAGAAGTSQDRPARSSAEAAALAVDASQDRPADSHVEAVAAVAMASSQDRPARSNGGAAASQGEAGPPMRAGRHGDTVRPAHSQPDAAMTLAEVSRDWAAVSQPERAAVVAETRPVVELAAHSVLEDTTSTGEGQLQTTSGRSAASVVHDMHEADSFQPGHLVVNVYSHDQDLQDAPASGHDPGVPSEGLSDFDPAAEVGNSAATGAEQEGQPARLGSQQAAAAVEAGLQSAATAGRGQLAAAAAAGDACGNRSEASAAAGDPTDQQQDVNTTCDATTAAGSHSATAAGHSAQPPASHRRQRSYGASVEGMSLQALAKASKVTKASGRPFTAPFPEPVDAADDRSYQEAGLELRLAQDTASAQQERWLGSIEQQAATPESTCSEQGVNADSTAGQLPPTFSRPMDALGTANVGHSHPQQLLLMASTSSHVSLQLQLSGHDADQLPVCVELHVSDGRAFASGASTPAPSSPQAIATTATKGVRSGDAQPAVQLRLKCMAPSTSGGSVAVQLLVCNSAGSVSAAQPASAPAVDELHGAAAQPVPGEDRSSLLGSVIPGDLRSAYTDSVSAVQPGSARLAATASEMHGAPFTASGLGGGLQSAPLSTEASTASTAPDVLDNHPQECETSAAALELSEWPTPLRSTSSQLPAAEGLGSSTVPEQPMAGAIAAASDASTPASPQPLPRAHQDGLSHLPAACPAAADNETAPYSSQGHHGEAASSDGPIQAPVEAGDAAAADAPRPVASTTAQLPEASGGVLRAAETMADDAASRPGALAHVRAADPITAAVTRGPSAVSTAVGHSGDDLDHRAAVGGCGLLGSAVCGSPPHKPHSSATRARGSPSEPAEASGSPAKRLMSKLEGTFRYLVGRQSRQSSLELERGAADAAMAQSGTGRAASVSEQSAQQGMGMAGTDSIAARSTSVNFACQSPNTLPAGPQDMQQRMGNTVADTGAKVQQASIQRRPGSTESSPAQQAAAAAAVAPTAPAVEQCTHAPAQARAASSAGASTSYAPAHEASHIHESQAKDGAGRGAAAHLEPPAQVAEVRPGTSGGLAKRREYALQRLKTRALNRHQLSLSANLHHSSSMPVANGLAQSAASFSSHTQSLAPGLQIDTDLQPDSAQHSRASTQQEAREQLLAEYAASQHVDREAFARGCARMTAVIEGSMVRQRLRQRACRGLCSEILEMQALLLDVQQRAGAAGADALLARQLEQQLRMRRTQLADMLDASAAPPASLPITKPLLVTSPRPSLIPRPPPLPHVNQAAGPGRTNEPAAQQSARARRAGQKLNTQAAPRTSDAGGENAPQLHHKRPASAKPAGPSPDPSMTGKRAAPEPPSAPALHTPVHAVMRRPREDHGAEEDHGFTTPSPEGPQAGSEEDDGSAKPFLKRRLPKVSVTQKLNWSEVKPKTKCHLEREYIPVRRNQPLRRTQSSPRSPPAAAYSDTPTREAMVFSSTAPSGAFALASREPFHAGDPAHLTQGGASRQPWNSNRAQPPVRQSSGSKFMGNRVRQSPMYRSSSYSPAPPAASSQRSPPAFNTSNHASTGTTVNGQGAGGGGSGGGGHPGPLDDILGQVTELLTQVNDILGR